jgi:hypothetical protein
VGVVDEMQNHNKCVSLLSSACFCRRGKKKGKGTRVEDDSESTSHAAVRTEAQPSDKQLSPKQRRKLLKEVNNIAALYSGSVVFH